MQLTDTQELNGFSRIKLLFHSLQFRRVEVDTEWNKMNDDKDLGSPTASELYPLSLCFPLSLSASVPISTTFSVHFLHPLSFNLSIPSSPLFTSSPPFLTVCRHNFLFPHISAFPVECLCVSSVPAVEGCALSGLYALAASPSTQQAPLLFNVTRPLLLRLSTVRVSPWCGKISGLQLISSLKLKTIEAPQRKHGYYIWTVLPFSFARKNKW